MEMILKNRMFFAPEAPNWKRGSSSLSSTTDWTPRLIHCTWLQEALHLEPRTEHAHTVYHVCLVDHGHGSVLLNSRNITTSSGNLIIVSPGEPHCFQIPRQETSCYSEATFEITDVQGAALNLPIHEVLSEWTGASCLSWQPGRIVSPTQGNRIETAIKRLASGCVSPSLTRAFQINRALFNLLEIVAEILTSNDSIADDPLILAAHTLEHQVEVPLSIKDLARSCGLSTNHFIRRFRERYGMTPLAFHQQMKINAAKRLLSQTAYPIKLIAEWTGFNNVYYFSRLFSAKTGCPPGAYRRRMQTDRKTT